MGNCGQESLGEPGIGVPQGTKEARCAVGKSCGVDTAGQTAVFTILQELYPRSPPEIHREIFSPPSHKQPDLAAVEALQPTLCRHRNTQTGFSIIA